MAKNQVNINIYVNSMAKIFSNFLVGFAIVVTPQLGMAVEQETIGMVLGEPVYRDQLADLAEDDLHSEIYSLFVTPVLEKYLDENQKELEPTNTDINRFLVYYQKQHEKELRGKKQKMAKKMESIMAELNTDSISQTRKEELIGELFFLKTELEPPGIDYAMFVLPHWKLHNHFYNRYGGGRILWQQRGVEAFDAHYKWIKEQESSGVFVFLDTNLQNKFYHYWVAQDHGTNLISDKKRITKEFLKPEWLSIRIKDKKGCFFQKNPKSAKDCKVFKRYYR